MAKRHFFEGRVWGTSLNMLANSDSVDAMWQQHHGLTVRFSQRFCVLSCLCYCQSVLKKFAKHTKGLLYLWRRKPDAINTMSLPTIPSWITNPSYHIYIMSFVETSTRVSFINTSCLFLIFPVLIPLPPLYMSNNVPIEKRMSYSHKYIQIFKIKLRCCVTIHSVPLWLRPMGVLNIICNSGVVWFFRLLQALSINLEKNSLLP